MAALKPKFIVPTGDNVYLDNESPIANTVALARHHWHRMYSLPRWCVSPAGSRLLGEGRPRYLFQRLLADDEGGADAPLTYEQGLRRVPRAGARCAAGQARTRTVRWGKDLEVWLVEGRDFRSPNNDARRAGQEHLGRRAEGVAEADAAGQRRHVQDPGQPDADRRARTAATRPTTTPTRRLPTKATSSGSGPGETCPSSFLVFCGDRHWQYHSVDPATGVQEFSCGPASDEHAGGSPGEDRTYHRFHRGERRVPVGDGQQPQRPMPPGRAFP